MEKNALDERSIMNTLNGAVNSQERNDHPERLAQYRLGKEQIPIGRATFKRVLDDWAARKKLIWRFR
jgi:hypothetical protein